MRARIVIPVVLAFALVLGVLVGIRVTGSGTAEAASHDVTARPGTSAGPGSVSPSPESTGPVAPGQVQPNTENYPITRLAPGQTPPQFVVLSFDGSCSHELMQHYLDLGQETNSRFTFFLSGLCIVPDKDHNDYHPPHKPVGSSAIGFADPTLVNDRIKDWSEAYNLGYGIGTHFLGHFCDSQGVAIWSKADWESELSQAQHFLDDWVQVNHDNPHADTSLKLSFNFSDIKGDRTPCLAGRRDQMYPVFQQHGFTYDASGTGLQTWPTKIKKYDLWNFPMPLLNLVDWPGHKHAIAMDYNFLFQMNGPKTTAPPAKCAQIQKSTYETYMAALGAANNGNRAPLILGNHFNTWACSAFVNALTQFTKDAHTKYPDVRFVSFDYLVKWLDAQSPAVLKALQARPPATY